MVSRVARRPAASALSGGARSERKAPISPTTSTRSIPRCKAYRSGARTKTKLRFRALIPGNEMPRHRATYSGPKLPPDGKHPRTPSGAGYGAGRSKEERGFTRHQVIAPLGVACQARRARTQACPRAGISPDPPGSGQRAGRSEGAKELHPPPGHTTLGGIRQARSQARARPCRRWPCRRSDAEAR